MTKKNLIILVILLLIPAGLVVAAEVSTFAVSHVPELISEIEASKGSPKQINSSVTGSHQSLSIHRIEPLYVADFSDDRVLVGASHNIFVGKVIVQAGTEERGIGPETQFRVEVIENIKGDLSGEVIVNQQGGYKDGTLYMIGEDGSSHPESYLLIEGDTYLFATRYNKVENWHTLNPHPAASSRLNAGMLSDIQLQDLVFRNERVLALKRAYPEEILIKADIVNKNTRNSFIQTEAPKPESAEMFENKPEEHAAPEDPILETVVEEESLQSVPEVQEPI